MEALRETRIPGTEALRATRLLAASPLVTRGPREMVETLTKRELQMLALLSLGCSNREIADTMFVSENTVKFHLKNIYGKLGARCRTQAVMIAIESDLISECIQVLQERRHVRNGAIHVGPVILHAY